MTTYNDNDQPIEHHQAPADIPKAQPRPLFDDYPSEGKVKIVGGMSEHPIDNPPQPGEYRTYIVKGYCKRHHIDEIDGERRLVVDIHQTSIYERGKVPIVDDKGEPGLFDADGEVTEGIVDDDVIDAEVLPADDEDDDEAEDRNPAFSDTSK